MAGEVIPASASAVHRPLLGPLCEDVHCCLCACVALLVAVVHVAGELVSLLGRRGLNLRPQDLALHAWDLVVHRVILLAKVLSGVHLNHREAGNDAGVVDVVVTGHALSALAATPTLAGLAKCFEALCVGAVK